MNCAYCGEELWSAREAGGVCCSCQGLPLDEGGDIAGYIDSDVYEDEPSEEETT